MPTHPMEVTSMTAIDTAEPAQLLDVTGVAALLSCSVRHVWRMADGGHFPRPIGIGMKLKRWQRSTVEQWLAEQTKPSTARR